MLEGWLASIVLGIEPLLPPQTKTVSVGKQLQLVSLLFSPWKGVHWQDTDTDYWLKTWVKWMQHNTGGPFTFSVRTKNHKFTVTWTTLTLNWRTASSEWWKTWNFKVVVTKFSDESVWELGLLPPHPVSAINRLSLPAQPGLPAPRWLHSNAL